MSGPGALLRAADERLYEAKKAGRNCSMLACDADGQWRDAAE
jgi:PleD family two-component response regulator